jgi:hypothetical protein
LLSSCREQYKDLIDAECRLFFQFQKSRKAKGKGKKALPWVD